MSGGTPSSQATSLGELWVVPEFSGPGIHSSTPMGPTGSRCLWMARSHLTKPPQHLSGLMGRTFFSKGSVCAAAELPDLRTGTFPGSRFVLKLNNATAPEMGMSLPRGAGCHSPRIRVGHSDAALLGE